MIQKRIMAAGSISLLLFGCMAAALNQQEENQNTKQQAAFVREKSTEQSESRLTFWYTEKSYQAFLETAAENYYNETGVWVDIIYQNSENYIETIYDATMHGQQFPDVYLIGSERLEDVVLYGIAAENKDSGVYEQTTAKNAVSASVYHEKMYGYPLSYNTCVIVYKNGYFAQEPHTVQSVIDFSIENEPPENVQYLVEWNVNDAFFDFPFLSNSISFVKNGSDFMQVFYDEERYEIDLAFLEQMLEYFSIDAQTVTTESVIQDFLAGKTLCAMLDSDSLYRLDGVDYSVKEVFDLNEELPAVSAALTNLVIVNDFSENKEEAAKFAQYATIAMSQQLYSLSGHYSVIQSEQPDEKEQIVYQAYENSVLIPCSQNAREFWVDLKETILQYF